MGKPVTRNADLDVLDARILALGDHRLLILGAPGAGKMTVMLDLTKSYLDKAEQDLSIPVPVVFTLSSWPGPATPFEDWLVSELRTRYGGDIRENVVRYWLAHHDQTVFLLERMKGSWFNRPWQGSVLTLSVGLIFGLVGFSVGLIFGLLVGLGDIKVKEQLRLSRANMSVGLSVGLLTGFLGLLVGLIGGLIFRLIGGLETVIKHYTLRLVLALDGSMPLCYVHFLDACAGRILLRKVGGGYMFIHRTFMEHIAALTPDHIAEIARRVEARHRPQ